MNRYELHLGDSRVVLRTLPENSIDSCSCDPPYALESIVKRYGGEGAKAPKQQDGEKGVFARSSRGFMGQTWDTGDVAHDPDFWREVYRVLKPGAWLVAFSSTRTYHRMATAIEDAGFLIDDQIAWAYASGMPKSHKPSMYIERTLCKATMTPEGERLWFYADDGAPMVKAPPFRHPLANAWWGWGTALKPAWEPIVLAQKPMEGTIAEHVMKWGGGVLNIDACRIDLPEQDWLHDGVTGKGAPQNTSGNGTDWSFKSVDREPGLGRWPANIAHDGSPEVEGAFPASVGQKHVVGPQFGDKDSVNTFNGYGPRVEMQPRGDGGGSAARFFFSGKASRGDRHDGAETVVTLNADGEPVTGNIHPTVKPTELMRWLCRLVTPPGGTVLDPFMGSGSTGRAAMLEGMRFVGIEREAPYLSIAEARIARSALKREVSPPQADLFAAE